MVKALFMKRVKGLKPFDEAGGASDNNAFINCAFIGTVFGVVGDDS